MRGRMLLSVLSAALLSGAGGCAGLPGGSPARQSGTGPNASAASDSTGATDSADSSEARSALASAADIFRTTSARFEITTSGGVRLAGVMDAASRQSEGTCKLPGYPQMDYKAIESDLYVRGVPGRGAKWVHYTPATLDNTISQYQVVEYVVPYLKGVATATQTAEGKYKGTIDVTKAAAELPEELRQRFEEGVEIKGPRGGTLAFEGTIGEEGRLTSLTVSVNARGKSQTTTMKFSDYGVPVEVAIPPTEMTVDA